MRHSTRKFFVHARRLSLRKLLDENPTLKEHEVAEHFGISKSTVRKEWLQRGWGNKYDPNKKTCGETFEPVDEFTEEKNIKVNSLIKKLIDYGIEVRPGKGKLKHKVYPLIKEYIELNHPFSVEKLCLYLHVSGWALLRHVNKYGGWENYNENNVKLKPDITEEENKAAGKNYDAEIEALKMHINILYELIEKNKECSE